MFNLNKLLFPRLLFPRFFCNKEIRYVRSIRGALVSNKWGVLIGKGCVISNVNFSAGCTIEDYVRLDGNPIISIGKNTYINCFTMMSGSVTLGDDVLISQFVNIWARAHRFEKKEVLIWKQNGEHGIDDQGYDYGPIKIGNGVWIGPHVTVFRGVNIGDGAVIGANSVVTGDIPEYAVAFGSPAKVYRFRK